MNNKRAVNLIPQIYLAFNYLLVFLVFLFLPFINSRLDPDVHHDGIMYTAALGASQGLIPNRDFFAQYGFSTPYLQGLWMIFTSNSLLSLHFFTAIQLALVSLLLFLSCKKFTTPLVSFLIAFAWVAQLSARIPWSSILVTICSLTAFLLLFDTKSSATYLSSNSFRLFLAGFVIALSTTFRLQNVVLLFTLLLAVLFFEKNIRSSLILIFGFLSFILLFLIFTWHFGIFTPMFVQTVSWPFAFYSSPEVTKSFVTSILWFPLVFLATSSAILFLTHVYRNKSKKIVRYSQIALTLILTTLTFFVLEQTRDGYLSLRNPKVLLIDGTSKFVGFLGFWSASACLLLSLCISYQRFFFRQSFSFLQRKWTWIIFSGVAALPQLYPLHDQVHLWYITPTLLIGCIPVLGYCLEIRPSSRGWIAALLGISILASLFTDIKEFRKERVPYSNVTMSGLLGDQEIVSLTDSKMKYLEHYAYESQVGFDCAHGLFAGAGQKFLSDDPIFVNWGPERRRPLSESSMVFVCNKTKSDLDNYNTLGLVQKTLWINPDNSFDAFFVRD